MPPKKNQKKEESEDEDDQQDDVLDLSKDPKLLAALQGAMGQLVGKSSGYIESLPADVVRRVKALKNIQIKHAALAAQFEKEVAALELKFSSLHQPLFDQRTKIIAGDYEPTDEEAHFSEEEEDDEDEDEKKEAPAADEPKAKGIPQFWLTVLQRSDLIGSHIEQHDVPVLEHLSDIKVVYNADAGTGFKLEFHFSPNEYFSDTVLTKTYTVDLGHEEGQLIYEGPSFSGVTGSEIHWNTGKNVGVKAVKKKQKKKGSNQTRVITKFEKQPTFFDFFAPPKVPANDEEEPDHEIAAQLEEDYEIGETIRDRLLPNAVLWFTGEALDYDDDDYDDGEGGEDGEEGDDDDEDDEHDPDYKPPAAGAPGQKPECKQS